MEELAKAAPEVGRVLALLTIHSPSTIADLRIRVQDLLPEAVILDVYPVAADRQLSVTVATTPSGPEPGIEELFRDYLAEQGTRGAAADRVMATFSKLLEAIDTEQEPVFPEEAAISGAPHADAAAPAVGQAGYQTPTAAVARPEAGVRTATCRTCGATFTTPIRRGRPPSQCPSCQEPQR